MSNPEVKKPQADIPLTEEALDTVTGGKKLILYDENNNRFCRECDKCYPPEQFVNNCCPAGHPQ